MTADVHIKDTGTTVRVSVKENGAVFDLSSATVTQFKIKRKDGSTFLVDATKPSGGSDGLLVYTSGSGDFTVKGIYSLQVYVENPVGKWHSESVQFEVGTTITVT